MSLALTVDDEPVVEAPVVDLENMSHIARFMYMIESLMDIPAAVAATSDEPVYPCLEEFVAQVVGTERISEIVFGSDDAVESTEPFDEELAETTA